MNNPRLDELLARIHELEQTLEADLAVQRERLHYRLEGHRARFEGEAAKLLHGMRRSSWRTLIDAPILFLLTAPVIYGVFFPLLLLDLAVSLYQWACFPVYGIPRVKRSDYFVYDRTLLPYLNVIEKFNCLYCSYGNGLIAWAREIVARTEQYWCPIKHARKAALQHQRQAAFFDYGDGTTYRAELERLRRRWDAAGK
ncbi:MAG: hypothetical protein CVU17_08470 [Betaproteobacteria bacterium HGW-Betaproteobacteria-11]|nr:MAG: hypothetical protein CVU17_08470 [Betaproteobacteria bacterium HGW-Betaproteobacteria-11]